MQTKNENNIISIVESAKSSIMMSNNFLNF